MYHCVLQDRIKTRNEPREVLLRLYGPSHGDTQVQLEIYNQLAGENLGPKLYGSFQEGRLEEYLPSNPLSWTELTDDSISAAVATKLAAIHKLDVECLDKKSNWLIDYYNQLNDFITTTSEGSLKNSYNIQEPTRQIAVQLLETDFRPEIDFLERIFRESKQPLVFSHNDLHQNNIILLDQQDDANENLQDRVVLIDFEYCSYNYRPFDLANHLMEWCFDYNGDEYPHFSASFERFPSKVQQKQFIAHYLDGNSTRTNDQTKMNNCEHNNHRNGHSDGSSSNGHGQQQINNNNNNNDDVEQLCKEMQPFLMGSNLLWAMWAIRSACTSEIAFGYWVSSGTSSLLDNKVS